MTTGTKVWQKPAGLMAAIGLAILSLASDVAAQGNFEFVFRNGSLDGIEVGQSLQYSDAAEAVTPLTLSVEAENRAILKRGSSTISTFDASVGNPVVMYFLEQVVKDVAIRSGGSPFYIRNRIKDAIVSENPVETGENGMQELAIRPFSEDPNRERLGTLAGLELTFTISETVPGYYAELAATAVSAKTGEGYKRRIVLEGME